MKTIGTKVNRAEYEVLQEIVEAEGRTMAAYLRELILADVGVQALMPLRMRNPPLERRARAVFLEEGLTREKDRQAREKTAKPLTREEEEG